MIELAVANVKWCCQLLVFATAIYYLLVSSYSLGVKDGMKNTYIYDVPLRFVEDLFHEYVLHMHGVMGNENGK